METIIYVNFNEINACDTNIFRINLQKWNSTAVLFVVLCSCSQSSWNKYYFIISLLYPFQITQNYHSQNFENQNQKLFILYNLKLSRLKTNKIRKSGIIHSFKLESHHINWFAHTIRNNGHEKLRCASIKILTETKL